MTVNMINSQAMFNRWYVNYEGQPYNCSVVNKEDDIITFVSYGFGRLLKEHPEYEGKLIFISEGSWIQPLLKKVDQTWVTDSLTEFWKRFTNLELKFRRKLATTTNLSLKTILAKLDPKERRTKKLLSFWFRKFLKEHKERLRRGEFAIRITWDNRQLGTGSVSFYKFYMTEFHYFPCILAKYIMFPTGDRDWTYFLSQIYLRKRHIFSENEIKSFKAETLRLYPGGNSLDTEKWESLFSLRIDMRDQEFFHFSLIGKIVYRYLRLKKRFLGLFYRNS